MKRPKICLFCGSKVRISKEHFWPQWLAQHLPKHPTGAHISEFHEGQAKHPPLLKWRSERPGAVVTKKIRAVCVTCNNTWMSSAEEKIKPIILSLLRGSGPVSVQAAAALAYWVALKSIVGEHATENTALTPPQDRHALRESGLIPNYFRLFVASHTLEAHSGYYRHSGTISQSLSGPSPSLPNGIARNIHATTFLVGRLCFYVTAIRATGINRTLLDPKPPMHRIWPLPSDHFALEALTSLNAFQVHMLSRSLERVFQHSAVRYGGPVPVKGENSA